MGDDNALNLAMPAPTAPANALGGPPTPPPDLPPQTFPDVSLGNAPQPAKPESAWKGMMSNILMGAVQGMAGAARQQGRGSFAGGLAGGAENELAEHGKEEQLGLQRQQIQFESVKAADSHIAALDEHRRAEQLTAEDKITYAKNSAEYQAFLQDNFGIAPSLSFNDNNSNATAGLTTLANSNGGTIPSVATVQQPAADGTHGTIAAYSPSQAQFQQNMTGYRKLIDTARLVQGMAPIDDATFNKMGFKGASAAAQDAITFLKPTPAFTMDKSSPNYLPIVLAQKQQQLQQYQDHKDANGKSDADPAVVAQLTNGINYLNNAWDKGNKMENQAEIQKTQEETPAKAAQSAAIAKADEEARLPGKKKLADYEQTLRNGKPEEAAKLLIAGLVAPSQVISARDPSFAQQTFTAAQIMQPGFNAGAAEAHFKLAENPQTQNTLNLMRAINDPDTGDLAILKDAAQALPKMNEQTLNRIWNATTKEFGDSAATRYGSALYNLATLSAQVQKGGVPDQSQIQHSLDLFKAAYSEGQLNAAIEVARKEIEARGRNMVKGNPYLGNMYPEWTAAGAAKNDPAAKYGGVTRY